MSGSATESPALRSIPVNIPRPAVHRLIEREVHVGS